MIKFMLLVFLSTAGCIWLDRLELLNKSSNKAGDGVTEQKSNMRSVIKYEIYEITECKGWADGKSVPQKNAKMCVVSTQDKNDPNYIYGQVSGGSYQELKTTNPAVYNTWKVGAIVTCEMEVAAAE